MPRVKRGVISKCHHKKIIKLAKGYRGRRKNVYRVAKQAVIKALQYSYRDRKKKKRYFRSLWIITINSFLRKYNINYSKFIFKQKLYFIELNRKILFNMIINNKLDFLKLIIFIRLL